MPTKPTPRPAPAIVPAFVCEHGVSHTGDTFCRICLRAAHAAEPEASPVRGPGRPRLTQEHMQRASSLRALHLHLAPDVYATAQRMAQAERRNVKNWVETLIMSAAIGEKETK